MGKSSKHQTFWFAVINYLGVAIGVVSTILVYPNKKAFLGVVRYVVSLAQLLFPVMVFGAGRAFIHFYPSLSPKNQKQLFKHGMVTTFFVSIVMFIALCFLKRMIPIKNYDDIFYAFPLAFALAFSELFKRLAERLQRITIPVLYEKIIPKIALPVIFILVILGYLDRNSGLVVLVVSYIFVTVLTVGYLFKHYDIGIELNFTALFAAVSKKEYYRYRFYIFIGGLGYLLAFRIDTLMIPQFLSFKANGTYSIGVFVASSLAIPAMGLFAVYGPKISEHIKKNEMLELGEKYVETSRLLFFVGATLYGSVLLGIDVFFRLMPTYKNLVTSIPVIIILGANVLLNMAAGFNSEIITYSKHYRFNIALLFVLVIVNVGLNVYFLTETHYGILGVAYATFIATLLFNVLKLYYVRKKFGLFPFDKKYLQLIVLIFCVTAMFYFLPELPDHVFNLAVKIGFNTLIITVITYKLKLVNALNYWIEKGFSAMQNL